MNFYEGQLVDEDFQSAKPTDAEALIVGRVILAASLSEDALWQLHTLLTTPNDAVTLRFRLHEDSAKSGVVEKSEKIIDQHPEIDALDDLLQNCAELMETRHGYARSTVWESSSGGRVLIRKVSGENAQKHYDGHTDVGIALGAAAGTVLCAELEDATRAVSALTVRKFKEMGHLKFLALEFYEFQKEAYNSGLAEIQYCSVIG